MQLVRVDKRKRVTLPMASECEYAVEVDSDGTIRLLPVTTLTLEEVKKLR